MASGVCWRCGKGVRAGRKYCRKCRRLLLGKNPRKTCSVCSRALRSGRWGAGTGATKHLKCFQRLKGKNPFIGSTDPHVRALRRKRRRLARRGLLNPKRRAARGRKSASAAAYEKLVGQTSKALFPGAFAADRIARRRERSERKRGAAFFASLRKRNPKRRRRRALNPSEASIMRKAMKAAWRKIKARG
jgi:hypothetical protein